MRATEQVTNLVWVAMGVAIVWHAGQVGIWSANGPGGGFLPLLMGLALGSGGAALLVREALRARARRPRAAPAEDAAGARRRVAAVLGGLVAMALLMPLLGFLLAAGVTMIVLLAATDPRRWRWAVVLAVVSTLTVYGLFDTLLKMQVPRGPFGF